MSDIFAVVCFTVAFKALALASITGSIEVAVIRANRVFETFLESGKLRASDVSIAVTI